MAEPKDTNKLSFFGHLEELRWRLVRVAIAILFFAVILFIYRSEAMDTVFLSMLYPDFPTYQWFCELGLLTGIDDLCVAAPLKMSVTSDTMMGEFSASMFYSILFHRWWNHLCVSVSFSSDMDICSSRIETK
jgi:sec-independent protein translocase protein TatC